MIKTPIRYDIDDLVFYPYPQVKDANGMFIFEAKNMDAANELVKRINMHDEIVNELEQMKLFLEDMHMMPIDWTIKESTHRHIAVGNLLERCK